MMTLKQIGDVGGLQRVNVLG